MFINQKLKHYFVSGILIEPGKFVDRHGKAVEFSTFDQFETDDVVPIYYEHGGPIVGFATRFYTSNGKLLFDGYVFDPNILQMLMSTKPGVSAELIKTSNGWVIVGIALTKHPAVENAGLKGVVALSSIKKELQQFLEENGVDQAEKIAALVEKFLAQFKYPSPELKHYEVKLSEAAKTIDELNTQIEELNKALEAKEAEIEELKAKCKQLEEQKLMDEIAALEAKIKQIAPDIELEAVPQDPQLKLQFLKSLVDTLSKVKANLSKEKLEFSASEAEPTTSDLDEWDRVISAYLNK